MYKLKLSAIATQGCHYVLVSLEVKGRATRDHANIMRKIKGHCMTMQDDFKGDFKGGEIELDSERVRYLSKLIDERKEKGVQGAFTEGVDDLSAIVDDLLIVIKIDEKAEDDSKKTNK
jgi:hypothetical protein